MERPFQCEKCKNWYIGVDIRDLKGNVIDKSLYGCRMCAEGTHAPTKAGVDCHWGHESATASEIAMSQIYGTAISVKAKLTATSAAIQKASLKTEVEALLENAENDMAQALREEQGVATAMRFAAAFPMPGIPKNAPLSERYRTREQLQDLNANSETGHRRPPEDLFTVERSEAVCKEMQIDIEREMGRAKSLMQQIRDRATNFKERVPAGTTK